MNIESKTYLDLARIWNVGPGEVEKMVRDYIVAVTCDFKPLKLYSKPRICIRPVKIKTLKERLEERVTMHEDCEWCIKRNICTMDVPKPCEFKYTYDDSMSDIVSYSRVGVNWKATYLPEIYQKKKEDNEMKATSVQNIKNVKDVCFSIDNHPIERESKLTIVASTNDDIFAFEFEGPDLLQSCKKAGLFSGWEKEQKIRKLELEKEGIVARNNELEEENKNLRIQVRVLEDIKKENEELKAKSKEISDDNASLLETNKKLKKENEKLKKELDLEKAANEAQRKFIKEYAGNDTEVTFNYAISSGPIRYGLYDKDYVDELRKKNNNLIAENAELKAKLCYKAKSADDIKKLKEQIKKLEQADMLDKEAADYWSKEHDILLKRFKKLQEENEQYKEAAERRFNEKFHDFEVNNKKYDGKIMEEILKRNSGRYSFDEEKSSTDNVNHPSHYTGKYECIDVMQDVFGDEATNDFCLCNAFKYIWRARKKNGLEDVKKAVWYLNKYIEEAEKDGEDEVTRT